MIISKREYAMLLGVASLAVEFCRQPETYPVFVKWLSETGSRDVPCPPIGIEQLEVTDIVITEYSHKLFKETRSEKSRSTGSPVPGTGADARNYLEKA